MKTRTRIRTPLVYDKLVGAYYTGVLANPGLKPEINSNYDAGIDMRLFKTVSELT
jgi:hypothetical protein